MHRYVWLMTLLLMVGAIGAAEKETPVPATEIKSSNGEFTVSSASFTRLQLVVMETDRQGEVMLHGQAQATQGSANIVMWVEVDGHFYFSKLPQLQDFKSREYTSFAIPFSSPAAPITKIMLEVELPAGGVLNVKDLNLQNR